MLDIVAPPADPWYRQPFSGRYWQVETATGTLTSRSLGDALLGLPPETEPDGALKRHGLESPDGEALLVLARPLFLPAPGGSDVARRRRHRARRVADRRA